MGRKALEIPNLPISASIPKPLLERLKARYEESEMLNWSKFVAAIVYLGLEAKAKAGAQ